MDPELEVTPEEEAEYQSRADRIRLPLERLESAATEFTAAAKEGFWAAYQSKHAKYDDYFCEELIGGVAEALRMVATTARVEEKLLNDHYNGPLRRGAEPHYLCQVPDNLAEKIKAEFGHEFDFWWDRSEWN